MPRKKPYPITDLTGGLNVSKDPLYLLDKENPVLLCARFDKGLLKKDMGWAEFGTPLLGVPMMIDTFYKSDGVYRVLCFTTTSAYRWNSTFNDWYDITKGVEVSDCETAWTASASVTATADTSDYKKGSKSAKLVIAGAFTTGLAAYATISETDITTCDHAHLWVKSEVALAAGDIKLLLDETAACASPDISVDFPALLANTWTRVSISLGTVTGLDKIISVGISVIVDKGPNTIYLDDIRAVTESTGTVNDPYSSVTFLDTYIVTNYKDAIKKYTGTEDYMQDLGGSPPKAKSITAFMNRLVVCFTNETGTDKPFKIRWTDVGTIETWTAQNYLEASDSWDWCTHITTLGAKCVVFKETSIWDFVYVGGTQVFELRKKVDMIGTQSPATVRNVRDVISFFAYDGIYSYNQAQVTCLSNAVYPMLFKTGEKTINLAAVKIFNAYYIEELREYWISLCEGASTTPSLLLKYSFEYSAYTRRNDKPITAIGYYERVDTPYTWATATSITWTTIPDTWGSRSLPQNAATTLVGYNTGQIYEDTRFISTTDTMQFETKDFMFGHAHRIVECRVESRYGGFTFYYSVDSGLNWYEIKTVDWTDDWTENVIFLNITTQRIRFRIITTEEQFELKWIEPWYITRVRSVNASGISSPTGSYPTVPGDYIYLE